MQKKHDDVDQLLRATEELRSVLERIILQIRMYFFTYGESIPLDTGIGELKAKHLYRVSKAVTSVSVELLTSTWEVEKFASPAAFLAVVDRIFTEGLLNMVEDLTEDPGRGPLKVYLQRVYRDFQDRTKGI